MEHNLLFGLSVIYFNNERPNIHAKMPPNKEKAKKLSKHIYKNAITAEVERNNAFGLKSGLWWSEKSIITLPILPLPPHTKLTVFTMQKVMIRT